METTILIIAVIALFILVAYFASGNSTKAKRLKHIQEMYDKASDKLNETYARIYRMEAQFRNLDKKLANNIQAFNSEGEPINYFRIKEMDEKDDFPGFQIGDKVPHVRRKVKYVWKNVPITLKFKRE